MFSYLDSLECPQCGEIYPPGNIVTYCAQCHSPYFARYNLAALRDNVSRDEFANRPKGIWRWHELLPVTDPTYINTLGEGDTHLLAADRLSNITHELQVFIKEEGTNPTGSFKARGMSTAISRAAELGISKIILPTAGNAGGAAAAYAARQGIECRIYMPRDTPIANKKESEMFGAQVIEVDGLISDAAQRVQEDCKKEDWFDLSTFKEPYRCEGKKIMGYEIAEAFNWALPDVIIYPTGGGTGLIGMWKAFLEMDELGWLVSNKKPRMVVVQAAGCAPVVEAFVAGKASCDFWPKAETIASGLRVPKSFADRAIMQTIYSSQGCAVAVTDAEITTAMGEMARYEGVFASPEGAATWSALQKLSRNKWTVPGEKIVLFNTGSGYKYLDSDL
jgi:threonine synthase